MKTMTAVPAKGWLVVSGWMIREGIIVQRRGDTILFRFREGGGIRIPEHRVYPTLQQAQAAVRHDRRSGGQPVGGRFRGNAWSPD